MFLGPPPPLLNSPLPSKFCEPATLGLYDLKLHWSHLSGQPLALPCLSPRAWIAPGNQPHYSAMWAGLHPHPFAADGPGPPGS